MSVSKKKNKKEIKETKKTGLKISSKLSDDANSLLLIVLGVVVFFGISFLLIWLLGKAGMFEKGYEKPTSETEEIKYDEALIGTVFNRNESEYYVVFDEFKENKSVYLNYILSKASDDVKIYKVDMSLGINEKYKSDTSNYNANSSKELKINGPTLIKIRNGKNILYLDNLEEIEKELIG